MKVISTEALIQQLHWRYATRKFDPSKKIPDAEWEALAETLRLAPSSYGLQPWKFIVVQNPAVRKLLRQASWNQAQIEDCSHLVVFSTLKKVSEAYIKSYVSRVAEVRQIPTDQLKEFENRMIEDLITNWKGETQPWTQRQAYLAMGSLLTAAALIKVDACPMEGLDPDLYDGILNLSGGDYSTVAAVTLGYRTADDRFQSLKKVRFEPKDIITFV